MHLIAVGLSLPFKLIRMKAFLSLCFFLPVVVSAQNSLTLQGQVTGLKDGTMVVMTDANQPTDTLAKTVATKGTFLLKAKLKEPTIVNIGFGPGLAAMTFLGNSNVKATGNLTDLSKMKFTGSNIPADFQAFQDTFNPIFAELSSQVQLMQSGRGNDSNMARMEFLKDSIDQQVDLFINQRRSSPVSGFLVFLGFQIKGDLLKTENRYARLKPEAVNNSYGVFVKDAVSKSKVTAVGSMAQDFTQTDTSGVNVSLSSFRGKYVLVDFWASWCGPCRQENPNVVENYNKFSTKNFTVLGVSLDRPGQKDRWLDAIHKDRLNWTHVSDLQFWNNAVAKQYNVQSIPQNLLIGPDGKIIAKDLRGPALEAKLCEILGCGK
ncbi:MAG: AhpC/TSA family protein [Chitinophagaceae bacterium]|nr:MAG: AhpC/TSA family protein [Chitinophagaceae bacterium]